MVAAFFSFGGWWDLEQVGGRSAKSGIHVAEALTCGVAISHDRLHNHQADFMYLVPMDRVTSGETFAAQAGEVLFGRLGGQVLSAIVVVAVLGSLAAVVMSAPRVYFAMARDGLFIPSVAAIHSRYETPARAIAFRRRCFSAGLAGNVQ